MSSKISSKDALFIKNMLTAGTEDFVGVSRALGVNVDPILIDDAFSSTKKFLSGEIKVNQIAPRTRLFVADMTRVNIDWIARFIYDIKRSYPTFFAVYTMFYHIGSRMRSISTFIDIMEGHESEI